MENTLENKAKFFAQYLGQKIGIMKTDLSQILPYYLGTGLKFRHFDEER